MKNKQEVIEYFDRISADLEFDIMDHLTEDDLDDMEDFDDLADILREDGAFNIDIIYYHKAMKYLQENDTSLTESLNIANDFGYKTCDLNSELLASLLASQYAEEEFYYYEAQINELLTKKL
jgi:predicted urease superfamily metal-dependent hydrolase